MKKMIAALLSAACLTAAAAGCSAQPEPSASLPEGNESPSQAEPQGNTASGKVTMDGSTSMEKLATALGEALEEDGILLEAQFTGSGSGIEAVASGNADIGNASRALKEEEKEKGVVENIVAIDGIAVITDSANPVTGLTRDQLIAIYRGEIKNWSELGGNDEPITVIGREAGSGTRGAFEELLKLEDECAYAQEVDSTGGVIAKVTATPGAIGYVSLDVIDASVSALSLDGVEATEANIAAGDYFLSRPFVMATKGEISEQNDTVQAVFAYLESDAGKELIESVGLILPQ